jgi:NAD(P)-dependent dehydrogenase (short-subunit alcohol dehydrogenase family)
MIEAVQLSIIGKHVMKDFKDKVVVITGAATGIGFALAQQFAQRGARIVMAARRRQRLEEAAAALASTGADIRVYECDVADREQVEALASFTWEEFGGADVLVNNAGIGAKTTTVIEASREDVQSVLDVNLFGVWNGVSVFGQRFLERGTPAAIYNVGSENCFFNAVPQGAAYIASKHALLAMTLALREEVPSFIEVGLICPGLVQSELAKETAKGMEATAFAQIVMDQIDRGEFFIVSHAYNIVRIRERQNEIAHAFDTYAPRYPGDDEFDVRTLGARLGWYDDMKKPGALDSESQP